MSTGYTDKIIKASHFWRWGLPAVFLILLAVVFLTGANMTLFLKINSFSEYTGGLFWAILTMFSDGLVSFVILLPCVKKRPQIIWTVLLATVISTLFGQGLKHAVNIPRPPKVLPASAFNLIGPDWGQHSFPSGHASMIFVLAGAFSLTTRIIWLRCVFILVAFLIALSRIVVGVHWPQDVLAGMATGWLAAWLGLIISKHSSWGWSAKAQKILGAILLFACVLLLIIDYSGYENIMLFQRLIAIVFFTIGMIEYLKIFNISLFSKKALSD